MTMTSADPAPVAAGTAPLPDPVAVGRILREVAAAVILPRFRNLVAGDVTHKKCNPRDLVTIADIEAERALEERLAPLVPGCAFVGEEAAEVRPEVLAALAGAAPVWLLDPVDGTGNFAAGAACFAVIVGFCAGGETLAGFILDPLGGGLLWAMTGQGAWLETEQGRTRVHASRGRPLGGTTGSLARRTAERLQAKLVAQGGTPPATTRYGSAGREYMDLATGTLDFASYTRLKPWDHAAGVLIHREAGGFSALRSNGSPYRPAPCIVEDTLLLSPDAASWRLLHGLLG